MTELNLELGMTSRARRNCRIVLLLCKMFFAAALLLVKNFQLHLGRIKSNNTCKQFHSRSQARLLLTPSACDCPSPSAGWLA